MRAAMDALAAAAAMQWPWCEGPLTRSGEDSCTAPDTPNLPSGTVKAATKAGAKGANDGAETGQGYPLERAC
jgi:hypothetical protein